MSLDERLVFLERLRLIEQVWLEESQCEGGADEIEGFGLEYFLRDSHYLYPFESLSLFAMYRF